MIKVGIFRDKEKVIGTIKSRFSNNGKVNKNQFKYLKIINDYEKNKNNLLIIKINGNTTVSIDKLKSVIKEEYNNLANYHNIAIIFENCSWKKIASIAIYCENFKKETGFKLFNRGKDNKIHEALNFLESNKNIKLTQNTINAVSSFYSGVSYGFQFNDLLISDNGQKKILIMQKIELDETILPCPDCFKKIVRGNSYPKMLMRSFECQNADCPSRSKIGRGKRYDFLSVKRNLYQKIKGHENIIEGNLLKKYRRDIFTDSNDIFDMLIHFFTWPGEKIKYVSSDEKLEINSSFKRKVHCSNFDFYKKFNNKDLPIESLFKNVLSDIEIKNEKPIKFVKNKYYSIYEGDSSTILNALSEKLCGAITSPPYYNAREYSSWPTLLCYLVDMSINAKAVYGKMKNETYYFYNIGDIVGQDNIYVNSQMSKRRIMLGFYSIMIFEILGYSTVENIIWDKGEVQSKRNSTENLLPSYIKPINCYEHVIVFGKKIKKINIERHIYTIDTVKKINSKGQNIYGHTAPYPEKIVEITLKYLNKKNGYLLDPYLGSGTTIIAGRKHGFKTLGIEYNKDYFNLAKNRIEIEAHNYQQTLL
jgi:DNA modification methylase